MSSITGAGFEWSCGSSSWWLTQTAPPWFVRQVFEHHPKNLDSPHPVVYLMLFCDLLSLDLFVQVNIR